MGLPHQIINAWKLYQSKALGEDMLVQIIIQIYKKIKLFL
jgi:hypothetical protein